MRSEKREADDFCSFPADLFCLRVENKFIRANQQQNRTQTGKTGKKYMPRAEISSHGRFFSTLLAIYGNARLILVGKNPVWGENRPFFPFFHVFFLSDQKQERGVTQRGGEGEN